MSYLTHVTVPVHAGTIQNMQIPANVKQQRKVTVECTSTKHIFDLIENGYSDEEIAKIASAVKDYLSSKNGSVNLILLQEIEWDKSDNLSKLSQQLSLNQLQQVLSKLVQDVITKYAGLSQSVQYPSFSSSFNLSPSPFGTNPFATSKNNNTPISANTQHTMDTDTMDYEQGSFKRKKQ